MKIAHMDTGREWRGGQGQVLLLMRELARRGHEQLLLAPAGPLLERAQAAGLDARRWDSRGEVDLAAMAAVTRELKPFAPDVAHLHSAHAHALGVLSARAAGARAVVVARRVDFRVRTNPVSSLKYALPVDRYFCISRGVMQAMLDSGIPEERLALVPSGIDFDAVHADAAVDAGELRTLLALAPDSELVGTVASLAPHKNHALLLEAVPAVCAARPRAHFVWVGEGECRAALERRIVALGLGSRVHLMGFHPGARALMRQFDLFVLSSYLEGLCTSLLDAQALGVPLVATAVGGIPEVITDGVTGSLVAGLEPEPLARAILAALESPGKRAGWVSAARQSVLAFSIERTAERSLAEYERILS